MRRIITQNWSLERINIRQGRRSDLVVPALHHMMIMSIIRKRQLSSLVVDSSGERSPCYKFKDGFLTQVTSLFTFPEQEGAPCQPTRVHHVEPSPDSLCAALPNSVARNRLFDAVHLGLLARWEREF
jgi:hypothetical protein